MNKVAVILYGPPGSGKGTQANLLAGKLGLYHFDTGSFLREILYNPKNKNNREIRQERKINEAGELNTPSWVLKIVSKRVKELAQLGQSIIFSGSPRTLFEAFGGQRRQGLVYLLAKLYGKNNIRVFALEIPAAESIRRNTQRSTCPVCKATLLAKWRKAKDCPFCGAKIEHRRDDRKDVIIGRLKEYRERTKPIFQKLKQQGYKVINVKGTPLPFQIHKKILNHFK